jgi:arylsulfatase A-like enzyme
MIDKIAPTTGKFMSFYTTVSSHGTYTVQNERFEEHFKTYDKNLELMKTWFADEGYVYPADKEYQSILKEYKSACMDTDEMIGKLFKHLNDTGLIQNTTVVLYSDHNAYYQNLTKKIKATEKAGYDSQIAYNVPLMIYSNKIASQTIESFCSTYDIYPTLCEMFGLPYNVVNAMGKDMFSENDIKNTIYSSALTGFSSAKCYSKTMQHITKYANSTDADVELFKINVVEFLKKQQILKIVYNSNRTY